MESETVKRLTADNSDYLTITVPVEQLPEYYNLTGSVVVEISYPEPQTLTYYYDSTQFVNNDQMGRSKGLGVFTISLLVLMVIGSFAVVYWVYRRWKARRLKTKVAF